MFGAYFLIGLMITCYSFTRKRESCLGVDHAIPKVLLLILILSVKDRCTLGRVWQDGGERSCWTGTQLAAAAAPTRVNTHICPEICNRFALIVLLYLCLCAFADFPWGKTCFQFAQAVNGEEGGVVNIVSQVGQSVSQSVGVSSNTDAWVWVWWTEENGVRIDHNLSLPVLAVGQCLWSLNNYIWQKELVKMTSKHLKEKSHFLSVKMAGCDKESD